mmetsp:Transcript_7686/g.17399  ORF Transcript_7686/g.17399 Transcript_7686/m.17399 type:complete len:375 (+) Transcript_7686:151-1275(+)|eukprot:CAMPEP_0172301950 /NCGR_PEP_ID=MMETSP1058-20130122/3753_1 /TAXON_ID=83371 /ORGANISM="Detonula confervacea, Strain CCMP 353" /LENGTH=374 /DNA_ID=CAMNT_0013012273 /DNA_START=73 /DNA_END=1197 /DNA_ORIENTATION=+
MCTNSNSNNASHRRRSDHEMMLRSSNPTNYESNQAPTAAIYTAGIPTSADDAAGKNGGIFRSSTARAVLAISSVVLLINSLVGIGTNHATNVKNLSDTVTSLSRQLHTLEVENENKIHEVETLEKQVSDKDIELAWENQHVENQMESQGLMHKAMMKQIQKDQEMIQESHKFTHHVAHTGILAQRELESEYEANANLKLALASALEELASARKQLPGGNNRGGEEKIGMDLDGNTRKLRGVSLFQPGDNIDIIEYEEGGKIALRPGIVSEVNNNGTFNLVKLEESIKLSNRKREQFQTYRVYEEGTPALYQEAKDVFAPITIVKFLPGSARKGFEIHGNYRYTYDRSVNKVVREARAMRIHRYAAVGENIGDEL